MKQDKEYKYKKVKLDNGLTMIFYPIKEVQSVYMVCNIVSGNIFAKPNEMGIAHFWNTFLFAPSKNIRQESQYLRPYMTLVPMQMLKPTITELHTG